MTDVAQSAGRPPARHALPPGCAERGAVAADVPAVTACVRAAYAHWVPVIGREPGPMLDDYAGVIAAGRCRVVECGSRVVGVLVLDVDDEGFLLDNVAVDPAYAGRGIGGYLMARAEREAVARGHATIQLYTHERMTANVAIYTRLGYVEYARRTERGFRRIYLRKALGNVPG